MTSSMLFNFNNQGVGECDMPDYFKRCNIFVRLNNNTVYLEKKLRFYLYFFIFLALLEAWKTKIPRFYLEQNKSFTN